MVSAARDRLAAVLRCGVQSAFSVELTARTDHLSLAVEGFGQVRLPVSPAKARKLLGLGQPALFGRGEQTLTDTDVRDTWEIPKHLVSAEWDQAALQDILATVKEELGLPDAAELVSELHSLLVYEPDQFFLTHQDSEKDDAMVGTLVVTLPSSYSGGELVVTHNEESKVCPGSRTALSLVAFYADCRHEVLKVKSGYRITLTYNLLLHGDTSRPAGDEGTFTELTGLLREHFGTPSPRYYGGPPGDPPKRLVYLLDHEYTPRGLNWQRLKGADASRVAMLRAAADTAGCEAVLALADIKTTHSAFPADKGYGQWEHRSWDDEYDKDDYFDGNEREYEIQELIESGVTLTHWNRPDGAGLEATSLFVAGDEACASTPNGDLDPYASEYEGYMGNWGNTLDRWYHRAAVVMWPREQAFVNRSETSPAWALDELVEIASASGPVSAQAAAVNLTPFWDRVLRARVQEADTLFGKALLTADAVADPATATMLLDPFRIENLAVRHVDSLTRVAGRYGQRWVAGLLLTWFGGDKPTWLSGGGPERPQWVADELPGVCARLHGVGVGAGAGGVGKVAARWLVDLAWEWIGKDISTRLALSMPSYLDEELGSLGRPLASVLTAAAAIGAAGTRAAICGYLREQRDAVTVLEMAALRAAAEPSLEDARGDTGFGDLAGDCAARLRARLARPVRGPDDWSASLSEGGCTCALCDTLRAFLESQSRRRLEWPLAKPGRQHVHSRIRTAELPVAHVTRRQGSPYTLILTKTDALFTREQEARIRDETDMQWLAAQRWFAVRWNPGA
jgi:predicted 2-oxoglutarate/Fe(II)-dependent dioxygenase YbiX